MNNMDYSFSVNLHDSDGDISEECVLVHAGDTAILKFKTANELEMFAQSILHSINEIRQTHPEA